MKPLRDPAPSIWLIVDHSDQPWFDIAHKVLDILRSTVSALNVSAQIKIQLAKVTSGTIPFCPDEGLPNTCVICHPSRPEIQTYIKAWYDNCCWILVSGGYLFIEPELESMLSNGSSIPFECMYGKEDNFSLWLKEWHRFAFTAQSFSKTKKALVGGRKTIVRACQEAKGSIAVIDMMFQGYSMLSKFRNSLGKSVMDSKVSRSKMHADTWLVDSIRNLLDSDDFWDAVDQATIKISKELNHDELLLPSQRSTDILEFLLRPGEDSQRQKVALPRNIHTIMESIASGALTSERLKSIVCNSQLHIEYIQETLSWIEQASKLRNLMRGLYHKLLGLLQQLSMVAEITIISREYNTLSDNSKSILRRWHDFGDVIRRLTNNLLENSGFLPSEDYQQRLRQFDKQFTTVQEGVRASQEGDFSKLVTEPFVTAIDEIGNFFDLIPELLSHSEYISGIDKTFDITVSSARYEETKKRIKEILYENY